MTTRQKINDTVTSSLAPMTSTVPRCHVLGATVSLALVVLIVWIGSQRRTDAATITQGETEIDINQAAALIQNADQWRQLYTENYRKSQAVAARIETIRQWLPQSVDWTTVEADIQSIGEANDLTITALKRGGDYKGKRVGVVSAKCDVTGSFASLARFLNGLTQRTQPIACSEIVLRRDPTTKNNVDNPNASICSVTLSLRIPYAAADTPAGELFALETSHEN